MKKTLFKKTILFLLTFGLLLQNASAQLSKEEMLKNLQGTVTNVASDLISSMAKKATQPKKAKFDTRSKDFDKVLQNLAEDLAAKVAKKNKFKLALADFQSDDPKSPANYIREEIEMHLINADKMLIMDRKHIQALIKEHKLGWEGMLDESVAKKSIAFIQVDGWVLGEITTFGNQVKVQLKAIDISNSQIFAVATSELLDIKVLKDCTECNGAGMRLSKASCTHCGGKGGPRCSVCDGRGSSGLGGTCEFCMGKGKQVCKECSGTGQMNLSSTCTRCKGTGQRS
ncbi:MAG: hypothetical protein V4663_05090 [Bacteroidota bacterium]